MRDSLINTCGMKMRKLLDKKSEVFAQKYGVRNVELDENDRRKRHIELTEKAVEAAKNMLEVHNECKEVVMRYVTDEEKELMNQIMQKMLRSLDEELQK